MRSTKSLFAAIVGVAMLATPITAAAAKHHHGTGNHARAAASTPRSFNHRNSARASSFAPAPYFAPRAFANNRGARSAAWNQRRDFDADDNFSGNGGAFRAYPSYGYNSYGYNNVVPAPAVGYMTPNYGSSCAAAQHAMNIARHDQRTGHPAAARDVLRNSSRALASCPGIGGMPANYSYGYNAPYQGYNAPYQGYNAPYQGYNAPYQASPYGNGASTMLAPLLQNFIH